MMYKTGRTRTLTQSATFSGEYILTHGTEDAEPGGPSGPGDGSTPVTALGPDATGTMSFAFGDSSITVNPYRQVIENADGTYTTENWGAVVTLTSGGGTGEGTATGYGTIVIPLKPDPFQTDTYDLSGTVTFSYELEEYISVTGSTSGNLFFAGTPDAPLGTNCRIWESIISSSSASDVAGVSLNCSYTRDVRGDITYGCLAAVAMTVDGGASGTWSIVADGFPIPTMTSSGGPLLYGSGSCSGFCSLTLSSNNPPGGGSVTGGMSVSAYYDKPVGVNIKVVGWDGNYPGSLVASITGVPTPDNLVAYVPVEVALNNGIGSISGTQRVLQLAGGVGYADSPGGPGTGAVSYTQTNFESNYNSVGAVITIASLEANGEDYVSSTTNPNPQPDSLTDGQWFTPLLSRCLARGATFPAMSLSLAETYPTPSGTTWPPAAASVTQTFTPEWPASSYPFLRIHVIGSGADNLEGTITIPPANVMYLDDTSQNPSYEIPVYSGPETPTKTWAFVTGTSGTDTTIEVPLCGPDNINTSPDTQDTDWPFPVRRPMYAGVWRIPSITLALDSPGAGQTIEVVSAELFRSSSLPKANNITTYYHSIYVPANPETEAPAMVIPDWPLKSGPDTIVGDDPDGEAGPDTDTTGMTVSQHYVARGLLIYQDGMQSLEEAGMTYSLTANDADDPPVNNYQFSVPTIAQLVGAVNGSYRVLNSAGKFIGAVASHPGWTAVSLTPAPTPAFVAGTFPDDIAGYNYYLCDQMGATGVAGAGLLRVGTSLTSQFDLTNLSSLPCQDLFDTVEWHPGWLGFEGEGQCLACGAVLRGQAQGQALQRATPGTSPNTLAGHKQPLMNATLTLTQVDAAPPGMNVGAAAGIGTSDSDGWYHTGGPSGRAGGISHAVGYTGTADSDFKITIDASLWWARHRHRRTFFPAPCPTLFLGDPLTYFPFAPQFSDPNVAPTEEWRRIKAAPAQQDSGSTFSTSSASASDGAADSSGDGSSDGIDSDGGQADDGSAMESSGAE